MRQTPEVSILGDPQGAAFAKIGDLRQPRSRGSPKTPKVKQGAICLSSVSDKAHVTAIQANHKRDIYLTPTLYIVGRSAPCSDHVITPA